MHNFRGRGRLVASLNKLDYYDVHVNYKRYIIITDNLLCVSANVCVCATGMNVVRDYKIEASKTTSKLHMHTKLATGLKQL